MTKKKDSNDLSRLARSLVERKGAFYRLLVFRRELEEPEDGEPPKPVQKAITRRRRSRTAAA